MQYLMIGRTLRPCSCDHHRAHKHKRSSISQPQILRRPDLTPMSSATLISPPISIPHLTPSSPPSHSLIPPSTYLTPSPDRHACIYVSQTHTYTETALSKQVYICTEEHMHVYIYILHTQIYTRLDTQLHKFAFLFQKQVSDLH